jgi:hypothetical protein
VHTRKVALGLLVREVCIPQSYAWGAEAQIDWYEAYGDLADSRTKMQVFAMRSMASGASFHRAYLHATQQAFLEAHELAFAYFGGVFRKLRYDNLTSAVKRILRGSRREETARFIALRSHWRFEADFCTPAEPHEKGGVEGEAGYFRRNHWVPVPQATDIADLNRQLLDACREDERRVIAGRDQSIGVSLLIEREHLLPLAEEGIDLAQISFPTVNGFGCAKVLTNSYSAPLPAGTEVQAKAYASAVPSSNVVRVDSSGFSTSNIISTFCTASLGQWPGPGRCSRCGKRACGRKVSIESGRRSSPAMESKAAQGR